MLKIRQEIVSYTKRLIGLEEKSGNSGFKEAWFERAMRKVGWKKYQSWCAYVAELIWIESYKKTGDEELIKKLTKLFSASAVQTYKNFVKAGYPHGTVPRKGSLVVWQLMKSGKYDWRGHIGVVTSFVDNNNFISGEGNTNKGKSRNGYVFWENKHTVDKEQEVTNGLRLIGFIHPVEYVKKGGIKKTKAYGY